jgi:hypothetical protein
MEKTRKSAAKSTKKPSAARVVPKVDTSLVRSI